MLRKEENRDGKFRDGQKVGYERYMSSTIEIFYLLLHFVSWYSETNSELTED